MTTSVYAVSELIGTSTESWEQAAAAAVEQAARTLRDLRIAQVVEPRHDHRGRSGFDLPRCEGQGLLQTRGEQVGRPAVGSGVGPTPTAPSERLGNDRVAPRQPAPGRDTAPARAGAVVGDLGLSIGHAGLAGDLSRSAAADSWVEVRAAPPVRIDANYRGGVSSCTSFSSAELAVRSPGDRRGSCRCR